MEINVGIVNRAIIGVLQDMNYEIVDIEEDGIILIRKEKERLFICFVTRGEDGFRVFIQESIQCDGHNFISFNTSPVKKEYRRFLNGLRKYNFAEGHLGLSFYIYKF